MSDSYAYQGTQDQGSGATEFNARDFHIRQVMAEMRTAIPVKIIRAPYDASGNAIAPGTAGPIGYVDVQPLVNQIDGSGNAMPHGTIYRLSYFRYQGAAGAFISDPGAGDIGHMVVADRDTSVVRSTNAPANPGSRRKFDLADGVYFGCPQAGPPTQWFAWTTNGFSIADKHGVSLVSSDGVLTITAPGGVVVNGATITGAGEVIDALGKVLGTHKHTEVQTGSSETGPPA